MTSQTDDCFNGFSWAVPLAFSEPLASCRFEQGDILYDTHLAYQGTWEEALPHIKQSLQVEYPSRGTASKSEKEEESIFTDNWNTPVEFTLTDFATNERKKVTTSQGRLYSLLWKGDLSCIEQDAPEPPRPTLAMQILCDLPRAASHFKKNASETTKGHIVFLMPFDRTSQLLSAKFRKVEEALSRFMPHTCSISPIAAGLQTETEFAPTVCIKCFTVQSGSQHNVENALKQALYIPSKEKKTDRERFRLSAHGHIFMI